MDAKYCCGSCGVLLNLSSHQLYPPGTYFEAGNRGTLSFVEVDLGKFRQEDDTKCCPFFYSLDSWGIQHRRTKLRCAACNALTGYIYYDMPKREGNTGFGPSQAVPRRERYRLKIKALQEAPINTK